MGPIVRWLCIGTMFIVGAGARADNSGVPAHARQGDLDARAHLQAVHDEMQRECGAAPGSPRCLRLKREFRQEARNYHRRYHR
jgi:hypothetical protein